MANVLTPAELERLRRYLLEPGAEVAIQHREDVRKRLRYQFIPEHELVECAKLLLLDGSDEVSQTEE